MQEKSNGFQPEQIFLLDSIKSEADDTQEAGKFLLMLIYIELLIIFLN